MSDRLLDNLPAASVFKNLKTGDVSLFISDVFIYYVSINSLCVHYLYISLSHLIHFSFIHPLLSYTSILYVDTI